MIQDCEKTDKDIVRMSFRISALVLIALSGFFIIIKAIIYHMNKLTMVECMVGVVLGWIILMITERK